MLLSFSLDFQTKVGIIGILPHAAFLLLIWFTLEIFKHLLHRRFSPFFFTAVHILMMKERLIPGFDQLFDFFQILLLGNPCFSFMFRQVGPRRKPGEEQSYVLKHPGILPSVSRCPQGTIRRGHTSLSHAHRGLPKGLRRLFFFLFRLSQIYS